MNKKLIITFSVIILASTGVNFYLYMKVKKYDDAWFDLIGKTAVIESILRESKADTSLEGMSRIAKSAFGADFVRVVEVPNFYVKSNNTDRKGLKVFTTLLLFKNGSYSGISVCPPGLKPAAERLCNEQISNSALHLTAPDGASGELGR